MEKNCHWAMFFFEKKKFFMDKIKIVVEKVFLPSVFNVKSNLQWKNSEQFFMKVNSRIKTNISKGLCIQC